MPGRRRCAPFVGRVSELASLQQRLAEAQAGDGGLVLIGGEPGVGKSRLGAELARRAEAAGWRVLAGHAYEPEGLPPCVPFMEALRDLAGDVAPRELCAWAGEDAAGPALLVPGLRDHLPEPAATAALSPEHDRYRLFEAVSDVLLHATGASGGMLLLNDLHWADAPSLLLRHLARRLPGAAAGLGRRLFELPRSAIRTRRLAPTVISAPQVIVSSQYRGTEALPAPSATRLHGENLNVFPDRLRPASRILVAGFEDVELYRRPA